MLVIAVRCWWYSEAANHKCCVHTTADNRIKLSTVSIWYKELDIVRHTYSIFIIYYTRILLKKPSQISQAILRMPSFLVCQRSCPFQGVFPEEVSSALFLAYHSEQYTAQAPTQQTPYTIFYPDSKMTLLEHLCISSSLTAHASADGSSGTILESGWVVAEWAPALCNICCGLLGLGGLLT